MKLELELKKAAFGHRLGPLFTFLTYRGNSSSEEPAVVLLRRAQFNDHGEPARIKVTIEWEDGANARV